ncbi:Uncharacterised protein [Vibrio cholerae]|nr:Uncharacterised protein [Vibrio cholerae]
MDSTTCPDPLGWQVGVCACRQPDHGHHPLVHQAI